MRSFGQAATALSAGGPEHGLRSRSGARHTARMKRRDSSMLVLGIMSGTSLDGVDCALCRVRVNKVEFVRHWERPFPPALQRRLSRACANESFAHELGQLHHDLGRFYTQGVLSGLGQDKPQLAGLHGQTVFHNPDRLAPATLQIGESAYLAGALQIPVASNFRAADLAAGGQGAPLAPLFHQIAFGADGRHVCVQNLGGIGNVTSMDWLDGGPKVTAFDTGPANLLMDLTVQRLTKGRQACDGNGLWASRGKVCGGLLKQWLRHPFLRLPPPKSTGREEFGDAFAQRAIDLSAGMKLSHYDLLATLSEFTACTIGRAYTSFLPSLPDRVVVVGGGASNPDLMRRIDRTLRELSPRLELSSSEAFGWPLKAVEPAAFALLAYYRWHRLPGSAAGTTGALRPVVLGQVAEP